MVEIEWILNDAMTLLNINNGNPLRHNDDLCRHQIIILLEVVNDAALCWWLSTIIGIIHWSKIIELPYVL